MVTHTAPENRQKCLLRSETPLSAKINRGTRPQDPYPYFLKKLRAGSRVFIIEGISGSGKDTLQKCWSQKLKGRVVHDYSEGEVLHSWKHLQIRGIPELRVKLMKLFVYHVKNTVARDEEAIFLFNRFHLSTYASTIVQQPSLGREYEEMIDILRTLPVHVFILQLDDSEIEKRSLHPERSNAWRKFQQQIVAKHSFRQRLEEQQRLILEAAKIQQIPYSVMKVSYNPMPMRIGQAQLSTSPSIGRPSGTNITMNAAQFSSDTRHLSSALQKG